MKNFFTVRTIAGLGLLTAMVIALQLLSNYVQFGPISITLALFPIAVGAMLYGPIGGFFLGLVDGVLVLLAPSTISGFFAITPIGTIITCLTKTSVAGLVAGFIFLLYKKGINVEIYAALLLLPLILISASNDIYSSLSIAEPWKTVIIAIIRFVLMALMVNLIFKSIIKPSTKSVILLVSISVPIINTGLFSIAAFTFFRDILLSGASSAGKSGIYFLIFVWIGWNFFLELTLNAALSSAFHNVYKGFERNLSRKGIYEKENYL